MVVSTALLAQQGRSGHHLCQVEHRTDLQGLAPLVVVHGDVHHIKAGLASGGVGDVLTGIIAGLLAQKDIYLPEAAVIAAYLHGRAGDLLLEKKGTLGLNAGDIPGVLSDAIVSLYSDSAE